MTTYTLLLALHVACAVLSVSLFVARTMMDEASRDWRQTPLRVIPHINDTVLLGAAIGLCVVAGWRPWLHGWLGAKVILLLVYIGLAGASFRQARRSRARAYASAALLVVALMFVLALTKPAFA